MRSADESEHDMTKDRIALLLADAAHEVEIGAAPVDAVVRAGRRRRSRRWAVTAVAATVLAGGTGTLALTGVRGHGGDTPSPATSGWRNGHLVDEPVDSTVGFGSHEGTQWAVTVRVWPAPRDRGEAVRQMKAMADWGLTPATSGSPSDLIGRTSYFVIRSYGTSDTDVTRVLIASDTVAELPRPEGTELHVMPQPLTGKDGPRRLVVGTVPRTAQRIACHWKDGSTTVADLAPENSAVRSSDAVIRSVRDYPTANWFVCAAPQSTTYKSAEVVK